jgi:hypothetical protein
LGIPISHKEMVVMKRMMATAAVCGVSLFGFTAVAGAADPPNPNPNGPAHTGTACEVVSTNNQALNLSPAPPGITNFDRVGAVFCGFTSP